MRSPGSERKRHGYRSGIVACVHAWANDGARTRDNQSHNLGLYQLSYIRRLGYENTKKGRDP